MKKISLIALSAMTIGFATPSSAIFYGSLGVGTSTDFQVGNEEAGEDFGYAIAIGAKVPLLPLRAEIESFSFRGGNIGAHDSISANGIMANVYAGLPIPIVSPSVGVGGWIACVVVFNAGSAGTPEEDYASGYENAYNIMAGIDLDIPLIPVGFSVEYRYTEIEAGDFSSNSEIQTILAKARLEF